MAGERAAIVETETGMEINMERRDSEWITFTRSLDCQRGLRQTHECLGTVCDSLPTLVKTAADVCSRLHEVGAFVECVSPTKAGDQVRGVTLHLITRAVVKSLPDAKVLLFGSFEILPTLRVRPPCLCILQHWDCSLKLVI